jgi:hypothetical protein
MVSVIGGTIASIKAARTTCVTRHKELVAPWSKRSCGERLQEILAEIVTELGYHQVCVQPTSRAGRGLCSWLIDARKRLHALERRLDLPARAINRLHLTGWKRFLRQ